jgi:FAD/FMN-containing dehydrogenase
MYLLLMTTLPIQKSGPAQKNRNPKLVLRPKSIGALQRMLTYLCESSDLDFAVRSGGIGSSSAEDVVLSINAFDSFEFDDETKVATIGAGQTWGDVDRKMEEAAPGYAGLLCPTQCPTSLSASDYLLMLMNTYA